MNVPSLLSDYLQLLPKVKGFSERNVKRMLAFYWAYADELAFVPQAVAPARVGQGASTLALPVHRTLETA